MFAGPNGSGKTTILNEIKSRFDVGYYVNADVIEETMNSQGFIDLSSFGIEDFTSKKFLQFARKHPLFKKSESEGFSIDITVKSNKIINPDRQTHSYEASMISDLVRNEIINRGRKLTFETVMSHKSKIEFLQKTNKKGYKNYLYFVSTESPQINKSRVRQRVKMGGHDVKDDKIEARYFRSLELLKSAIGLSYRTFIFDNSGKGAKLILEIYEGKEITFKYPEIPKWVEKYVLN